jgi:hypothetical protein
MTRRRMATALAALGAAACGTAASQPRAIAVDIAPCVGIEAAVARLDCYDALARDAAQTPSATVDELTSEIVALRELEPGRYEIALANGQLWRQTSSDRYRLQTGQPVRVYRARAGSRFFRLTVPALRGFVQVERIR